MKKALFALAFVLIILLLCPHIISNINSTFILSQVKAKIVKLSKEQKEIVPKVNSTSSMSSRLFSVIKREKRLNLFSNSNLKKRNAIEEDNFFGLNEYFSKDGFTLKFPVNRSLHLATSLSPLDLEQSTKLRLKHKNRLAIFNSEVTLGFTGNYGLGFGLTKHF